MPPEQLRGKHIREVLGEELYRLNQPYIQAVLKNCSNASLSMLPT
ncbi:hypothetical protein [Methylomicrobium album]